MAKNNNAAAAAATVEQPNELYDNLTATEQEVFDLIGSLGFRPDRTDGGWVGLSINGDDVIPAHETLSRLCEAVQAHVAQNGAQSDAAAAVELDADHQGNRYLPGTAPIVDPQIAAAAGRYHALKTERVALLAKEVDAKDELITICHQKSELFKPDPDNSNAKIYKVGDLVVRIQNEWKEKITTAIEKKKADA